MLTEDFIQNQKQFANDKEQVKKQSFTEFALEEIRLHHLVSKGKNMTAPICILNQRNPDSEAVKFVPFETK